MDLQALLQDPELKFSQSTRVILPSDPSFTNETQRWNSYHAPTYSAAIRPGNEEDVQKAIQLAISNKIPFLATGGNHGYSTTFGGLQDGLAIDLRGLDSISIDKAANTVTIGGGVIVEKLINKLFVAEREIPTGLCSSIGYLGFTLGGGLGRHLGIHGLALDSLLSVCIVTGTGDLVTASADTNPDLFWGIRGAGTNFGVVTSATYRIYPLTNSGLVQSTDLVFGAAQAGEVFKVIQRVKEEDGLQPRELVVVAVIAFNPEAGEATVVLNITYPGPEDKFQELLKPFLDISPVVQAVKTYPLNTLTQSAAFGTDAVNKVKGHLNSVYGVNIKRFDAATWTDLFDRMNSFLKATPAAAMSGVIIEVYNTEVVKSVGGDETAYPWRDAEGYAVVAMRWTDPGVVDAVNDFGQKARQQIVRTSGYDDLAVYVNYCHGNETVEQRYGASKLARLRELKKWYDPDNVFCWNNAIQ